MPPSLGDSLAGETQEPRIHEGVVPLFIGQPFKRYLQLLERRRGRVVEPAAPFSTSTASWSSSPLESRAPMNRRGISSRRPVIGL